MSAYELGIIRDRISILEQRANHMQEAIARIEQRLEHLDVVRVAALENTVSMEYHRITTDMHDALRSMARSAVDAMREDLKAELRNIAQQAVFSHERDRHP